MYLRLVFCLLLLTGLPVQGRMLSGHTETPLLYMQTREPAAIWSRVGDKVIPVGTLAGGQLIAVVPTVADYYEFTFGFGNGFIDKAHLKPVSATRRVEDRLGDLHNPLTNQNLLTFQDVTIYSGPANDSDPLGTLAANLRYPIIGKLKDRLNQTWYQIRIGGRLGWVSSLDAELDNGIAILTYHHILRDEENTRFRHTSTTTSVVAFSNQMTWLREQGYSTLTMYQLEGYLRNRLNVPAKSVVVTFDDGLKSVSRYGCPILRENGIHATAFIVSSRIKRHPQLWNPASLQFMSLGELAECRDVLDLQSHTHFLHRVNADHRPVLLSRSYHNILFDFERSRRALEQFTPRVWYLSYPFGGYNANAVHAASAAGFHMAVTTVRGKVKPGDNLLLLKRLYILRTDSLDVMARLISNRS